MQTSLKRFSLALMLASSVSFAQTAPDAGQVLRETQPQELEPQPPSTGVELPGQPLLDESETGGEAVVVERIRFQGNTVYEDSVLNSVLTEIRQQRYELADLRRLANRISEFYRENGYPFARAYLPAQQLTDGTLTIAILEGVYGEVRARGELAEGIQPFLDYGLQAGDRIESRRLERATLLIGDLPGVTVSPVMRPGDETGEGDLDMHAEKAPRVHGSAGIDNHGNRFTGAYRAMADFNANRLFMLGDELGVTVMATDERMWFGSMRYERPLGYSGLRGFASIVRADYELGTSEFDDADIGGIVDIAGLGASYPLVRSQTTNLSLSVEIQHKEIVDDNGLAGLRTRKDINVVPFRVRFDHRDALGGGGVTYGAITAGIGELDIRDGLQRAIDDATAETDGRFARLHLDAARIQNLPDGFSGYLRMVGQWANANLDSAEGMTLGGPRGVRAYPQGEASGDMGLLAQFELRYAMEHLTPYLLIDKGRSWSNADTWDDSDNTRSLSGAGFGVRADGQSWAADVSAAWRIQGGEPRSDTRDDKPRLWASFRYGF